MQPQYGAPLPPTPSQPQSYDFILNPGQPPKRTVFNGRGMLGRVIIAGSGALVLIIAFVIVSSLVSGSSGSASALLSVTQAQQELIHITDVSQVTTNLGQTITDSETNFVATANLVFTSNQSELLSYLKTNGTKVSTKQLGLGISALVDQQLSASVTAGTYSSTFMSVVQTEITNYKTLLKHAYQLDPGPKGQALLNSDYNQANLLLTQLTSSAA